MSYIKLNRKFFDNFLWNEARVYSKAEAWLDLIQNARFEASTEIINGKVIELQRGELPASRRFLELRWGWGNTKVSNFLKILTDLGMINQRQTNGQTIVMLVKYGVYNDSQTEDKPETNQGQTSVLGNFKKNEDSNKSRTNHQSDKKQTNESTDYYNTYDNDQTNDHLSNKPMTNQRQTTGKPTANQNKEREEIKELNKNISPNGDCENPPDLSRENNQDEPQNEKINYQEVIQLFHDTCKSFPEVKKLTDARKNKIKTRIKELKKQFPGITYLVVLKELFKKAEESDFLRGNNKSGWKCSFDWLFENGKNWVKVYEGNYETRSRGNPNSSSIDEIYNKRRESLNQLFT